MELTNEVNNLVAQKIADEIIAGISEEEITKFRTVIWNELNQKQYNNCFDGRSKLEKASEKAYINRFSLEVERFLSDEYNDIAIKERAKEFVEKCRARAEEKIIEKTSDMIAGLYCGYEGGFDLKSSILWAIKQEFNR